MTGCCNCQKGFKLFCYNVLYIPFALLGFTAGMRTCVLYIYIIVITADTVADRSYSVLYQIKMKVIVTLTSYTSYRVEWILNINVIISVV